VWWLTGVAKRFGVSPPTCARAGIGEDRRLFPELVTGGDMDDLSAADRRPHRYLVRHTRSSAKTETNHRLPRANECNGSDVFGSDICTCRHYLAHRVEVCTPSAAGGVGVIVYHRKKAGVGRGHKFLV